MANTNQIVTFTHEQALEEIEKLQDCERYNSDGCDVWRGIHPEHGPTVIIMPAFGNALSVPYSNPSIISFENPSPIEIPVTAILNTTFDGELVPG